VPITAQVLYLQGIYLPNGSSGITKIWFDILSIGGTYTLAAGIYDQNGNLKGSGGTASLGSTGFQSISISSSSLTAGTYWIGFLNQTAAGTVSLGASPINLSSQTNGPQAAVSGSSGSYSIAGVRSAAWGSTLTSLPNGFSSAAPVIQSRLYWMMAV
jgi:hypothetical protein